MAIQSDGKIVVAGDVDNGSNDDFAVARYNADGSLDTTFDGDGKVTTAIGTAEIDAYAVAIQADGKIVVAGDAYNGSDNDFAVVRYNADGSLDTTFDGDGKVTTAVGIAARLAHSVAHPGRREDRGGRGTPTTRQRPTISPWCATTPTAAWTRPSTATAR